MTRREIENELDDLLETDPADATTVREWVNRTMRECFNSREWREATF